MKLKSLKLNYVAIKEEKDESTRGGIIIPQSVEEKTAKGVVVMRGPGGYQYGVFVENRVSQGEHVVFSKHGILTVVDDPEHGKLYILRENDVIGSLEKPEEDEEDQTSGS